MTNNENPRLCGGTFFTLVLEARKDRYGVREHYMGAKDGLSEVDTLLGLARIIQPDLIETDFSRMNTLKGNTSEYKSCKNKGGTYLPFGNAQAIRAFDDRVKNTFSDALDAMFDFCETFLALRESTKKDEALIRALVELVAKDDTIEDDRVFYIGADGEGFTKAQIIQLPTLVFQPFLLGVFHFAVTRSENAAIGQPTFNRWCPPKGGATRVYEGDIGRYWPNPIALGYMEEIPEKQSTDAEPAEDAEVIEILSETSDEAPTPKPAPQMNFTFNVTGNNNSFYQHVDSITNNYYRGRKDDGK